jgi:hypothetical protein
MIRQGKQPLFEKSGAKTFLTPQPGVAAAIGPQSTPHVMAGLDPAIHAFAFFDSQHWKRP